MNKETILENAQEFIEEYDKIKDTLENLFDDIKNKDFKEEINGLLSEFEEDFKPEYEEQLQIAKDIEEEEQKALNEEYERSRL